MTHVKKSGMTYALVVKEESDLVEDVLTEVEPLLRNLKT